MTSIRRQLTRELLGAVLLLLGGGLAALYLAARDSVRDQFDLALQAKARAISTLTFQEGDSVRVAFNDRFMHGFELRKPRDFFQLWDADDREIARSESLSAGRELPKRIGSLQRPAIWNFTLPHGRPGRAVGFAFVAKSMGPGNHESGRELKLVVASDREELDETLWQLLGLCAGVSALLVGATLWLIPRVLRRGLQPLEYLGERATHIDADSLATRFAVEQLPAELQPIGRRLNDLLGRLEQSFERERRFSADLAHELRTPLAELRSMAECALKWPESRDPGADRDTLAIAQQMERIVTHILALARGEQGQLAVTLEAVPIEALIEATWPPFAARAAERQLKVSFDVTPVELVADPALLRAILNNLFENAVDYASAGGEVRISVKQQADEVIISVANTVENLAPDDLPKLFDRFWRKESARSGGLHLGLGLSLSRSFAQAMGWTLTAGFDDQQRLLFKLVGGAHCAGANVAPAKVMAGVV